MPERHNPEKLAFDRLNNILRASLPRFGELAYDPPLAPSTSYAVAKRDGWVIEKTDGGKMQVNVPATVRKMSSEQ